MLHINNYYLTTGLFYNERSHWSERVAWLKARAAEQNSSSKHFQILR